MIFRIALFVFASIALGPGCLAFDRVPIAQQGCVSMTERVYVPGENGVAPPVPERGNQFPKLRGSASFEFVVSAEGSVCEVILKRSNATSIDTQLAVAKLKAWRFKPAQRDGKAVAVRFTVNINNAPQ